MSPIGPFSAKHWNVRLTKTRVKLRKTEFIKWGTRLRVMVQGSPGVTLYDSAETAGGRRGPLREAL